MSSQTLLRNQLGKNSLEVCCKHSEQKSRHLNFTAKVNSHVDRAVVMRGVPWSGTGQVADICMEPQDSKSGERQVILGFVFHWEQSADL